MGNFQNYKSISHQKLTKFPNTATVQDYAWLPHLYLLFVLFFSKL